MKETLKQVGSIPTGVTKDDAIKYIVGQINTVKLPVLVHKLKRGGDDRTVVTREVIALLEKCKLGLSAKSRTNLSDDLAMLRQFTDAEMEVLGPVYEEAFNQVIAGVPAYVATKI